MKFTIVSRKYGSFDVLVDDSDWVVISQYKWVVNKSEKNTMPYMRTAVKQPNGKRKWIRLTHMIMPPTPGTTIDHISCDTLDNRRSNLRYATKTEQSRNRRKFKSNKSGSKGVYFENFVKTRPWRASICVDYKAINLGRYSTIEQATEAYAEASKQYHGSYGRID
jgi:hypothetical protein